MSQNSAFLEPLLRTQNNSIGPAWLQNQSTIEAKWAQNDILGRQREVLGATGPAQERHEGGQGGEWAPRGATRPLQEPNLETPSSSRTPTWTPNGAKVEPKGNHEEVKKAKKRCQRFIRKDQWGSLGVGPLV